MLFIDLGVVVVVAAAVGAVAVVVVVLCVYAVVKYWSFMSGVMQCAYECVYVHTQNLVCHFYRVIQYTCVI